MAINLNKEEVLAIVKPETFVRQGTSEFVDVLGVVLRNRSNDSNPRAIIRFRYEGNRSDDWYEVSGKDGSKCQVNALAEELEEAFKDCATKLGCPNKIARYYPPSGIQEFCDWALKNGLAEEVSNRPKGVNTSYESRMEGTTFGLVHIAR